MGLGFSKREARREAAESLLESLLGLPSDAALLTALLGPEGAAAPEIRAAVRGAAGGGGAMWPKGAAVAAMVSQKVAARRSKLMEQMGAYPR